MDRRPGFYVEECPGGRPMADLEALPEPAKPYDLAQLVTPELRADGTTRKGFESEAETKQEERYRIRRLLNPPKELSRRQRRGAKRLGRELQRALNRGSLVPTAASARFMREWRRRYGGLLLKALEADPGVEIVQIIQADEVTAKGLRRFDVAKLKNRLRGQIHRQLRGRQGFILLFFTASGTRTARFSASTGTALPPTPTSKLSGS